jgi:hypothetical protein
MPVSLCCMHGTAACQGAVFAASGAGLAIKYSNQVLAAMIFLSCCALLLLLQDSKSRVERTLPRRTAARSLAVSSSSRFPLPSGVTGAEAKPAAQQLPGALHRQAAHMPCQK